MKIIAIIIAVIAVIYVIAKRNSFESMRQAIKTESANIGIYEDKCLQYLDSAMDILKVSHQWEVSALTGLTGRDQYDRLLYLGQKYPELKANSNFSKVMDNLGGLQDDISATQILVNSNINAYNASINSFPENLVAMVFGYKSETLIDEENIEKHKKLERKKIDFSKYL